MKLDVTAMHFELDKKLKRYATKHIGAMDKFVPRGARGPLNGQVVLSKTKGAAKERYSCEVTLHLPHGRVVARVATPNSFYAAIDIAEEKVRAQLLKYKTKSIDQRQKERRLLRRLRWRR